MTILPAGIKKKPSILEIFRFVEMFGLYGMAFALPTMESPKTIAFALFVCGTLGKRVLSAPISWRRPDVIESLLLGMFMVSLVSTVLNWPLIYGLRGLGENAMLFFLFWGMYRNTYSARQIEIFVWVVVAGTMVALVVGFWGWMTGRLLYFEFHSAGCLTESAVYLGVSLFIMFGLYMDTASDLSSRLRRVAGLCAIPSLCALFIMGSRGALLAAVLSLLTTGLFLYRLKRFWYFCIVLGMALLLTGTVMPMIKEDAAIRLRHLTSQFDRQAYQPGRKTTENDSMRIDHWRVAIVQMTQGGKPFFGIGPSNSRSIDVTRLKFNTSLHPYFYQDGGGGPHHAHNLFLTKGCEEGILGLTLFVLFLGYIAFFLIVSRPRQGSAHWAWIAGTGAMVVPIVAGSFNSAFTNENGWLAMLLLGLFMSRAVTDRCHPWRRHTPTIHDPV